MKKYKKVDARKEESKWMEKRWRDEYMKDPYKCVLPSSEQCIGPCQPESAWREGVAGNDLLIQ